MLQVCYRQKLWYFQFSGQGGVESQVVMLLCLVLTELPLEPALGRTLLAAQDLGCLPQALTVAAMLSCETIFFQAQRSLQPPFMT